jgi:hypothetical protein
MYTKKKQSTHQKEMFFSCSHTNANDEGIDWLAQHSQSTYMINGIAILPSIQRLTETGFMLRLNYI